MKTLRFEFRVVDDEGEVVLCDFTTFSPRNIDTLGACETVDIHVGTAMRAVRRDLEREIVGAE